MGGNFDEYWLFKYLTENILMDGNCLSPYTRKGCNVFKQFDRLNRRSSWKVSKMSNFPPGKNLHYIVPFLSMFCMASGCSSNPYFWNASSKSKCFQSSLHAFLLQQWNLHFWGLLKGLSFKFKPPSIADGHRFLIFNLKRLAGSYILLSFNFREPTVGCSLLRFDFIKPTDHISFHQVHILLSFAANTKWSASPFSSCLARLMTWLLGMNHTSTPVYLLMLMSVLCVMLELCSW